MRSDRLPAAGALGAGQAPARRTGTESANRGIGERYSPARALQVQAAPRVLVVDDSDVARRALATVLESSGFHITHARSARDADALIDQRAAGDFDVVLMDLHMPEITGIEACARLKRRAGWEDVPVIVVTASDDDQDLTLAFAAGATDYITKPPRDFELLARVRAALRLKDEMTRRRAREAELEHLNHRLQEQKSELAAAQRALQDLNEELERRVCVQVEEIVARAREVEELNARLRVQVQERSRELAEALRRVSSSRGARPRQFTPGRVLGGRVRLLRHLADGGMGVIYAGEDLVTGSAVAVKLLDSRLGSGARDLQRFISEAEATAAIPHPAVVGISHVDVTGDGELFLLMELVDGVTLEKVLAHGPVSPAWCVSVGSVVADALAAAHRVNVVHRDIKPSNLMISRTPPGVRVLDFGISKIRSWADRVTMTETGNLLGTPAYMAPEQFEHASVVTAAADVYGLGAVMYEMVTGLRPFRDLKAKLSNLTDTDTPVESADVHPALAALIGQCLARDPRRRPPAHELAAHLAALAVDVEAPHSDRLFEGVRRQSLSGRSVRHD